MRRRLWIAAAAAACALGAGCPGKPPAGAGRDVSREEFIETYVALLRAEAQAADSAEARQRRAWVLERRNLTAADLERFAERHADDPAAMAEIWKEIETRIRALQAGDTAESGADEAGEP